MVSSIGGIVIGHLPSQGQSVNSTIFAFDHELGHALMEAILKINNI